MAAIALLPQIAVPTAISVPSRAGSPSQRVTSDDERERRGDARGHDRQRGEADPADRREREAQTQQRDAHAQHALHAEAQPRVVGARQADRVADREPEPDRHERGRNRALRDAEP